MQPHPYHIGIGIGRCTAEYRPVSRASEATREKAFVNGHRPSIGRAPTDVGPSLGKYSTGWVTDVRDSGRSSAGHLPEVGRISLLVYKPLARFRVQHSAGVWSVACRFPDGARSRHRAMPSMRLLARKFDLLSRVNKSKFRDTMTNFRVNKSNFRVNKSKFRDTLQNEKNMFLALILFRTFIR